MPHLIPNKRGFIAIVALGIFMLLSLFGIIVSRTTITTINNIRITNDYYHASDLAFSATEKLRLLLKDRDAGYNLDEVTCEWEEGTLLTDPARTNDWGFCSGFEPLIGDSLDTIKMNMRIRGRSRDDEGFGVNPNECPGIISTGECYITPIPGTGDAGERCNLYTPNFTEISATVDDNGQTHSPAISGETRQVDYSCNWNKISFGSSSTDRAAIPFYWDTGAVIGGEPVIQNPFNIPSDPASHFSVRVRPPCKPCNERSYGSCGADETICDDRDRYKLDDTVNEVAVQWQMSGLCDDNGDTIFEECGLVQVVVKNSNSEDVNEGASSAITEERINNYLETGSYQKQVVLKESLSEGITTSDTIVEQPQIIEYLREAKTPLLSLFLTENLVTPPPESTNVPYLEYQILTDKPIGSPKTFAEVSVNVNGYVFDKTLAIEQDKPLIDFAVQN